ncbi:PREDICTED: galectin-7 [Myotis brandtii]|uniref:galectin-7 n=1 Tax=Myotis brandtii TaxID=109478 RepID=UPI0003BBF351|nr:PREDICTED: galectin-7 [Myotis brandtii]XP_005860674.1 PREDICTED: galectin-7 [Myotis brandtii]
MAGSSNVPHKTSLPEGVRVGTVMRIRGVVPDKARRFHVNLLCSEEEGAEAALHFNPRLDESTVVFNTKERGAWGQEERGHGLPFQRGQPFDVLLIATEEGFKVCLCHRDGHRDHIPPGAGQGQPGPRWRGEQRRGQSWAGVLSLSPSRGARSWRLQDRYVQGQGQSEQECSARSAGVPRRGWPDFHPRPRSLLICT